MNKNFQKKTAYDHVKQTKKGNFSFLNEKYARHGQTVLFGDSITEIFNSYELFYAFSQTTGQAVYNRGISGDTSDRLLKRLECNALNINPKNLVILIGTNDIGIGLPPEYTLKNIQEILQKTQKLCQNTNIVLQAIYPVNSHLSSIARQMVGKRSNKKILAINEELHKIALDGKVQWLDLTKVLSDEKGRRRDALIQISKIKASKKAIKKYFPNGIVEFDSSVFEELFKAEDENELELHNSLKAMKQAKENKNTAEVQQLKAKVKQLQFQKAKIKEEIKDATEKNSIYYRAAKPYLDAKRTLIQASNYSHFDDIKLLYADAKARLDALETEQLAVK